MKKRFLSVAMLLVCAFSLTACDGGISQEDYDAAVAARQEAEAKVADLEAAVAEAAPVQEALDAANAQLSETEASLAQVQEELTAAQSERDSLSGQLSQVQQELEATTAQLQETADQLAETTASYEALETEYTEYKKQQEGDKLTVSGDVSEKYQDILGAGSAAKGETAA